EFLKRFVAAVSAMKLGASYTDLDLDMGSLTSEKQLKTVTGHVEDAVAKGATVHIGGAARPELAPYFYAPTVLTGVTPEMTCHAAETFGPVVSVYPVASEAEAVRRANDTEYGLNASVFTRSRSRGQRVGAALRAGTVNVNDTFATAYGSIDAPMGGMGASGLGRRHASEGLLKYTDAQNLARLRFPLIEPPPQLSRQTYVKTTSAMVRILSRLRIR
ncbi:MAG: aldehyde dehydrogenase family protein, partial [Micromonosporaceae bacterium]